MSSKYRRGTLKGTIVTDYPEGDKRQYMINVYGGKPVVFGIAEENVDAFVQALNNQERLLEIAKTLPQLKGIIYPLPVPANLNLGVGTDIYVDDETTIFPSIRNGDLTF